MIELDNIPYAKPYSQKMHELLRIISNDLHDTILTLQQYHDIIANDNVIIISTPNVYFDLQTFEVTCASTSYENIITISVGPDIMSFNKFIEKIKSCDGIMFIYPVFHKSGSELRVRYTIIPYKQIHDHISLDRIKTNMNLSNSYEEIQSYVNSDLFKHDCEILKSNVCQK